jgi:hypothetical protein
MYADMLFQAHTMPERFPAHLTLVGTPARVCTPDMDLESVGCGEAFVTFHTLVRRILGYFSLDGKFGGFSDFWHTAERRFLSEVVQEVRSSRAWPAVHRKGKGRKKVW